MAASGSVIALRQSEAKAAAEQLQAAVKRVSAYAQEAEGAGLGELLTRVILPQAAYNGLLATAAVTLPAVWMRR